MSRKITEAAEDAARHARCFYADRRAEVCELCREKARRIRRHLIEKSISEARLIGADHVLKFWQVDP